MTSHLRFTLVYLLYLSVLIAFTLAGLWAIRWNPRVTELRARHRPASEELQLLPHVDQELMKRLGHVKVDKRSSFTNFDLAKKSGTVRLCAFGDSFTYGAEVNRVLDYPALLQSQFDRQGYPGVEVINFGSEAYGFHQTYMMWEAQSQRFGCDAVLLGPECFQPKRETRFNHSDLDQPYYLHSRFVLADQDVRRVDVPGDTHRERFDEYFRFFPRWLYLRYERSAPPSLLSMVGRGRTLDNPFYYSSDTEAEEAWATYRTLLRKLAANSPQVVLTHDTPEIVGLARDLQLANLSAAPIYRKTEFPYLAPRGHNSGLGNVLVAQQYLASLVGARTAMLTILTSADAEFAPRSPRVTKRDISSFDRVEVRIGDRPLGYFFSSGRQPVYSDFQGTRVDSLLAVKSPATSILDALFVPLEFSLHDGDTVTMALRASGEKKRYVVGRVRLIDPRINIGVVEIEGVGYRRRWKDNKLQFDRNDTLPLERFREADSITLSVDEREILKTNLPGGQVAFRLDDEDSGGDRFYELRCGPDHFVDVDALPDSGRFDLYLRHADDGEIRVPIAEWTKAVISVPVEPAPRALRGPAGKSAGQ